MDMIGQLDHFRHTGQPMLWSIGLVVLIIFALYVFVKIEHFIVRLAAGFLGIAVVAAALWWLITRH